MSDSTAGSTIDDHGLSVEHTAKEPESMKRTQLSALAFAGILAATSLTAPALAATETDSPGLGAGPSQSSESGSEPGLEDSGSESGKSPESAGDEPSQSDGKNADSKDSDSTDSSKGASPQVSRNDGITTKTFAAKPSQVKAISLDADEVNILGASWQGYDPGIEIRYKDGSGWSKWEELAADDEGGPDPASAEAGQIPAAAADGHSEAVPILDATAAEVRTSGDEKDTTDLEITNVVSPVTTADTALAKKTGSAASAPSSGVSAQVAHQELGANIVTRKEWGADEKLVRCETDKTSTTKGIFIHHTAGSNSYTKAQAPGIIRGYLAYHTKERGWCDLGYNFLVDKYGTIYEGRAGSIDLSITGAHASGFNSYTLGISVMGTFTGSAPATAAQNSVKRLVAWKANQYSFNPTGKMTLTSGGGATSRYPEGKKVSLNVVSGHRDTSYTECPGTAFYGKLGSIRSGAKSMQSKVGGYPVKGAIGTYFRANSKSTGEARGTEKALKNPNGAYQHFAKGTVYWSSPTGAHLNKGGIRTAYKAVKYEKGVLGFPKSDEKKFKYRDNAAYQNFASGMITWSSKTKGQPLSHGMLTKWKSLGWERSSLGLPTSGEFASKGKTRQNFEHGYMTYKKGEGVKVYAG